MTLTYDSSLAYDTAAWTYDGYPVARIILAVRGVIRDLSPLSGIIDDTSLVHGTIDDSSGIVGAI